MASAWDTPLTDLRLSVGDIEVATFRNPWLPSSDVQQVWPQLVASNQCRFSLRAGLTVDQLQQIENGAIVSITPTIGATPAVPLERIWPLRFPAPTSNESEQVGHGDFTATSFEFLTLFRLLAGLGRSESVLETGCGLGRMAFALAHYLGPAGRYEGFDVAANLVHSAAARYSGRNNFRFQHADIFNRMYNPSGKLTGDAFKFPYRDQTFDFVLLTSVFTHMLQNDLANYMQEIGRVLRSPGRCVATFFVLDEESEALIQAGQSSLRLNHRTAEGGLVQNAVVPEEAIAHPFRHIQRMAAEAGLKVAQFHPGQWAGRARFLTYQDVCVFERR